MFKNNKEKSIVALKQARRIIGKMIKMSEAGEPCKNIMSQNAVAVSLLQQVHRSFMETQQTIQLSKYKK